MRTSEDFGTQGEKPSHPELLDWLATEFQERGWSMKQMHKLIVMSAAYRQSSAIRKDIQERDPDNDLIARQSRLRLAGGADPRRGSLGRRLVESGDRRAAACGLRSRQAWRNWAMRTT